MGQQITVEVNDFDKFQLFLYYICPVNDENCTFSSKNESNVLDYNFFIRYSTKVLDNDNEDSPVKDTYLNYKFTFSPENYIFISPNWEVYNYEEKKGVISRVADSILNKQYKFIFGRFSESVTPVIYNLSYLNYGESIFGNRKRKMVLNLRLSNSFEGIHQYQRKAISIWDYLANIAALGTTIFNGFCKVFALIYSKNFDNYKIIESLLSKETKKIKKIELSNVNIVSNSNLENHLIDKSIDDEKLQEEKNSNNDDIINDDTDDNEENDLEIEEDRTKTKLPKLRFFDFFFNNVYSKCCIYIKRQKLIDSCDEVLYNYYSIENILYNQIIFENLMKDYHWNNPELKTIHKNKLIIDLKKYT